MNIIVCIKQVPDTQDIKWSENNNIVRDGMLSILNPQDEYAINNAVKIKNEIKDVKITALSMGPIQAKNALKEALALGVDEAFLLCDKKFIGSDTLATGKTLAKAIQKIGNFDLILCGQYALDGDTAQTGITISNFLDIEHISWANSIKTRENEIEVKQELENGYNILLAKLPCLVSMSAENFDKINPRIADYIKAQNKEIRILTAEDINIDNNECGMKGSPTWVSNVFRKQTTRKCIEMENFSASDLIKKINEIKNNE